MTTAKKAKPRKPKRTTDAGAGQKLTWQMQLFIEELLADRRMIGWRAYQKAFRCGNRKSCEAGASRLLSMVKIQNAIQAAKAARLRRVRFSADEMFNHLLDIAMADVNELMQYRRLNCRHCHGIDHNFQWRDEEEFEKACDAAEGEARSKARELGVDADAMPVEYPDDLGGYGYDPLGDPNDSCPKCNGEGRGEFHIEDTRFLTGSAHSLFAGIKLTKEGLEIKTHDQMAAKKMLAQHMGFLDPKLSKPGDKSNPLAAILEYVMGNTLKPKEED